MAHTDRKSMEVHQRLDAFKLRVLARPAPTVDVMTLQAAVESLRADLDTILEARVSESKALLQSLLKTRCWLPLFSTTTVQPAPARDYAKRHRVRDDDES